MAYLGNKFPYGSHLTHNIVYMPNIRGYLAVMKVFGTAFDLASNRSINTMAARLSNLWTSLGKRSSDELAIWITIDRHSYVEYVGGEFPEGFSKVLNDKYKRILENRNLKINDIYISVIYRPIPNQAAAFLSRMFEKVSKAEMLQQQREDIARMESHLGTLYSGTSEFYPDLLTTYEHNGIMFSEVGEFLHYLASGYRKRIPVSRQRVSSLIAGSQPLFTSSGAIVQVLPYSEPLQSVMLGNTDLPREPHPKLLDELLTLPFDLIVTHSFEFMGKQNALSMMSKHRAKLENAADKAVDDIADIAVGENLVTAGDLVFGDYSFSAQIFGDHKAGTLQKNVAEAFTVLNNAGLSPIRYPKKTAASAFFSRLPGMFSYRTKLFPASSDNFAHVAPLHNFPRGRKDNTQWDVAVAQFGTNANTPFFLNLHKDDDGGDVLKSREVDPDKKLPANMMLFGRTGSGKSTALAFLVSEALKYWELGKKEFMTVMLDLDGSQANMIRANGGRYFTIKAGENTGWQPLQLPPTAANRELARSLLLLCIKESEDSFPAHLNQKLTQAINTVMSDEIPKEHRRFSALLEFFSPTEPIYAEILQWCEGQPFGWVFDNKSDDIDLDGVPLVGFDNTAIFNNPFIQERAYFYLLQRIDSLLDGRRFLLCVEELGQLGSLAAIDNYFESKQVRVRKFNAAIIGLMQHPGQARGTQFEKSIATQPTTHIYFPDKKGLAEDYMDLMKLSRKEFSFIQNCPPDARQFMIKQGDNSVIIDFDLHDIGDEVSILSGNPDTVEYVSQLIKQVGNNPDDWLPLFYKRRKELLNPERNDHEYDD